MNHKIIKSGIILSLAILFLYSVLNRYKYQNYSFIYPRSWVISEIRGNYFNGLLLSSRKIGDNQKDYDFGGYLQISIDDVDNNLSVENYINELKNDEVIKLKAGGLPTIPGPSQYEYKGVDNLGLKGFYRVTSLSALPDDMHTRLYWKISNKKLYQVFIKYPQDKSQSAIFNIVAKLFFLTFDTK